MSSKAIILIIGLVAVATGLGFWLASSWPSSEVTYAPIQPLPPSPSENNPANFPEANLSLPAATGNIDDAVSAILEEATSEGVLLDQESNQASQVSADSQAIGDIEQSSNETQEL